MKFHKNSIKRICFPRAIYYIVIKTKHNYPYFKESVFCDLFIENLKVCKEIKGFKLYGFSVIYDHINLIIEPSSEFNISKIIKSLKENVSRDINVVIGYTQKYYNPLVGETPAFRLLRAREYVLGLFKRNRESNYNAKKLDIDIYKEKLIEKFGDKNFYPKFRWQLSFYDHYIRFHDNHLKKQKDWDYHYEYTVYNHLRHGLPENWPYISLNYPKLIDSIEK